MTPVRLSGLPGSAKAALLAQFMSVVGLGAQTVVLVLVILQEYGSLAPLAALLAGRSVGTLVGFPVAGWCIARFGALRCVAATHVVFVAWAASLGVLATAAAPVWSLVAVSVVAGFGIAVDSPARYAGIADLAGEGGAAAALSLLGSSSWVGRLVGVSAGAALWAVAPISAFVFNAASYVVPAVLFFVWRDRCPPVADVPSRPTPWRSLVRVAGSGQPARVCAALTVGALTVEFGVFAAVIVERHGAGAVTLSALEAVMAVGAVGAGWVGARRSPASLRRAAVTGWATSAVGAAVLAVPWLWGTAVGLAVCVGGVTYAAAMSKATLVRLEGELRGDALTAAVCAPRGATAVAAPVLVAAAAHSVGLMAALAAAGLAAAAVVAHRADVPEGAGVAAV